MYLNLVLNPRLDFLNALSSEKISVGSQVSELKQQATCCQDLVILRGFPTQVGEIIQRNFLAYHYSWLEAFMV